MRSRLRGGKSKVVSAVDMAHAALSQRADERGD